MCDIYKTKFSIDLLKIIALPLFLLFFYIYYSETQNDNVLNNSVPFLIIFTLASMIFFSGILMFEKINRCSDYFASACVFWAGCFLLNSFKLSYLQNVWDVEIAILVLIIPLIVVLLPSFFKVRFSVLKDIPYKKVVFIFSIFLLTASYLILIYEFKVTGIIPLLTENINESRVEYSLPFIHVVSEGFLRLSLVLFSFFLFSNYKFKLSLFCVVACQFYFVVTFSRSGIMESIIFVFFMYSLMRNKPPSHKIGKKLIFSVFALVLFSTLGNLRQNNDFDISKYSQSKIESSTFNWFYSYYAVNMDNLALSIEYDKPTLDGRYSFLFYKQITGTKAEAMNTYTYIGKLNLGTGLRDYTMDWGVIYGSLVFISIVATYMYATSIFKTKLAIASKALILSYIALLPLTSRFSQFMPFFILCSLFLIDRFFYMISRVKN